MSVKGKVKKLNKKIENLQEELQTYQLSNSRLRNKNNRLKTELEEQKADKQYWICNNKTSISTRIIKSFPVFKG